MANHPSQSWVREHAQCYPKTVTHIRNERIFKRGYKCIKYDTCLRVYTRAIREQNKSGNDNNKDENEDENTY